MANIGEKLSDFLFLIVHWTHLEDILHWDYSCFLNSYSSKVVYIE